MQFEELVKKYKGKPVHVIGDGESLNDFADIIMECEGCKIGVNMTLYHPGLSLDMHLSIDDISIFLKKAIGANSNIPAEFIMIPRSKRCIYFSPRNVFPGRENFKFTSSDHLTTCFSSGLLGSRTIFSALNLAFLLQPSKIFLWGADYTSKKHWYEIAEEDVEKNKDYNNLDHVIIAFKSIFDHIRKGSPIIDMSKNETLFKGVPIEIPNEKSLLRKAL